MLFLAAGARGYLLKDETSGKKLFTAIKEVVAGGRPMTPVIARKVIASFERNHRSTTPLSSKEQEVLRYLSHGLINKEIADKLGISVHTVHTHLASIYEKLHVHSRTDAAMFFVHDPMRSQPKNQPRG